MDKRGIASKIVYGNTEGGIETQVFFRYNSKTDHIGFTTSFHKSAGWNNGTVNNKKCATYLGVTVAEQVLFNVFNHVERMPNNNKGFDFKCNLGYMIDVKSSTKRKNRNSWRFNIVRNPIVDYFLRIAFDNRQNLNPLYIWLIPSKKVNYLMGLEISVSTMGKWNKYELSDKMNKVITCCNTMRST